jgi:dihydrolipoamide dehydrogenase
VTLVEPDGLGGACVLYDCVPSKTLIATSETMSTFRGAPALGVRRPGGPDGEVSVEAAVVNRRVKDLAAWQSEDVWQRLSTEGVRMLTGRGRFAAEQPGRTRRVEVVDAGRPGHRDPRRDVVLLATGAPRGCCPARSRTASGSSPGGRSTT